MRNEFTYIRTFSGRKMHSLDPRPEDISIYDIAHALSNQCRFTGHTKEFYSVAQHSVIVANFCPPKFALWGLLHDASEAYLSDIASPIKRQPEFAIYKKIERGLMDAICEKFGLPLEEPPEVKEIDRRLFNCEQRDLMPNYPDNNYPDSEPLPIHINYCMEPGLAKDAFMSCFKRLYGRQI